MRKAALALGVMFVAGAGGLLLSGVGAAPAVAVILGVVIFTGVVAFFGLSTGELAVYAVGLMLLTITWNGLRVGGGALGNASLALAFAAVMAHVVSERRPLPVPMWLFLAGLGCLLAGLLSMIFPPSTQVVQDSVVTLTSFKIQDGILGLSQLPSDKLQLVEYEVALVLVPMLIAAVATTPRRIRLLLGLFTAGAIVNACAGIADFQGIAHLGSVPFSGNRSAGLTVQSNYLALTCVIALPTAMMWFGRSRRATIGGVFGFCMLLGGVYVSGSRAGTIAAVIAVGGTMAVLPRLRPALRTVLPIAGMVLVVLLLFTHVGTKILQQVRLGHTNSTAQSDSQRSIAAQVAWEQIKARPLQGVGFSVIANAHDIYLELLNAGGVIALAAFLTFIGGLVKSLRRALDGVLREEGLVCGVAIATWLANGIFDNQVADKYLYVVPGLLFAIGRTSWLLSTESDLPDLAPEPQLVAEPRRRLVPQAVAAGAP